MSPAGGIFQDVNELFALVHRDAGAISTFPTLLEAAQEMARVVIEEPDRVRDLRLERVAVSDAAAPDGA